MDIMSLLMAKRAGGNTPSGGGGVAYVDFGVQNFTAIYSALIAGKTEKELSDVTRLAADFNNAIQSGKPIVMFLDQGTKMFWPASYSTTGGLVDTLHSQIIMDSGAGLTVIYIGITFTTEQTDGGTEYTGATAYIKMV